MFDQAHLSTDEVERETVSDVCDSDSISCQEDNVTLPHQHVLITSPFTSAFSTSQPERSSPVDSSRRVW